MTLASLGERRLRSSDEFSIVLLIGVGLQNRLGLIGGGSVAQEARLDLAAVGAAPVPDVEKPYIPPSNEILPAHGVQLARGEGLGIQSVSLPDQGSGHRITPAKLKAPPACGERRPRFQPTA